MSFNIGTDGETCNFYLLIERTCNGFGGGSFNLTVDCEIDDIGEAIKTKINSFFDEGYNLGIPNDRYDIVEEALNTFNILPYFSFQEELPENTYGSGLGTILRTLKYKYIVPERNEAKVNDSSVQVNNIVLPDDSFSPAVLKRQASWAGKYFPNSHACNTEDYLQELEEMTPE